MALSNARASLFLPRLSGGVSVIINRVSITEVYHFAILTYVTNIKGKCTISNHSLDVLRHCKLPLIVFIPDTNFDRAKHIKKLSEYDNIT